MHFRLNRCKWFLNRIRSKRKVLFGIGGTILLVAFYAQAAEIQIPRDREREVTQSQIAMTSNPLTLPNHMNTLIPPSKDRMDEYNAQIPKTVFELQPFRQISGITMGANKDQVGTATLINLNPWINAWFLLRLDWNFSETPEYYHIENSLPVSQTLLLDPHYPQGLSIGSSNHTLQYCDLWSVSSENNLSKAADSGKTYAPLCDGRIYVRNKAKGHKTTMESVTDLLRKHVYQGEKITAFVKETFYQDAYLETADITKAKNAASAKHPRPPGAPAQPLMNPLYADYFLVPKELGIDPDSETGERILIGRWYSAKGLPGIYVSVTQPDVVAETVIESQRKVVNPLDDIESTALVYMVAFDLDRFDLGFEMGTENPSVGWSERVKDQVRDNTLPGPDGIDTLDPLVRTGLLNPAHLPQVSATFIGGFKRYHGAFLYSELAFKNHGSHYGFIEHGTILSKLQPGLSTVLVFQDGAVDLKTWSEKDNHSLNRIRHARQNGVAIIEYDEITGTSRVGTMVPRWSQGNWSGSVDKRLRTVRAGLGLHENEGRRYLIYGYFSSATPSALARIFQAYMCKYALLLDINALEHTYLAVYTRQEGNLSIHHLVKGMSVLDKPKGGQILARFVEYADNRDFFYLLNKEE